MAVSPDGKLLASGAEDGWIIVWDAATLKELYRLRDPEPDSNGKSVDEISFSPDGRFLAARCGAFFAEPVDHVWEVSTGRELAFRTPEEALQLTGPLCFSPDKKWYVAATTSKIYCCPLDAPDKCQELPLENDHMQIKVLAISPDSKMVIVGDTDGTVQIYSLPAGKLLRTLKWPAEFIPKPPPEAPPPVNQTAKLNPSNDRAVAGQFCALFDEGDSSGGGMAAAPEEGRPPNIYSAAFSPDGKGVVLGAEYGLIGLFDVVSGKNLWAKKLFDSVEAIRFSDDGKQMIVQTANTFLITKADKPDVLQKYDRSRNIWSVYYSPDGKHVLTAGQDHQVKMWEAATGKLQRVFPGLHEDLHLVVMTPDGKQVIAHSTGGVLYSWNAKTGELISKIITQSWSEKSTQPPPAGDDSEAPQNSYGNSSAFDRQFAWPISTAGGSLPVASANGLWMSLPQGVCMVSLADPGQPVSLTQQLDRQLANGRWSMPKVEAISNDGNFLLVSHLIDQTGPAASLKVFEVWSTVSDKRVARLNAGDALELSTAAFSDDNTWVAIGDIAGSVTLYAASNGKRYASFAGADGTISALRFSHDARQLVAGCYDGAVYVWDRATAKLLQRIASHNRAVTSVAISPDGKRVVTSGADETTRAWDLSTGKELVRYTEEQDPTVAMIDFAPQGQFTFVQKDGQIQVADKLSGKAKNRLATIEPDKVMTAVAISPDGKQAYVGSMGAHDLESDPDLSEELILDGLGDMPTRLARWNISSGAIEAKVDSPQASPTMTATAGPNLPLLTAHMDGKARRWNSEQSPSELGGSKVKPAEPWVISPDEQKMIVLIDALREKAEVRDVRTGKTLCALPGSARGSMVDGIENLSDHPFCCFSPDSRRLLWAADRDLNSVVILGAETGRVLQKLVGHRDAILAGEFSPDGKWVATTSEDKTVRIWNAATGRQERRLVGHKGPVASLAWRPDSAVLATGGGDGQVIVWNAANGSLVRRIKVGAPEEDANGNPVAPPQAQPQTPPDTSVTPPKAPLAPWEVPQNSPKAAPAPPPPTKNSADQSAEPAGPWVHRVSFSPDGKMLLSCAKQDRDYDRSRYELWDANTGKELVKVFKSEDKPASPEGYQDPDALTNRFSAASFSPNGKLLLGWGLTEEVLVWDTATGKIVHRLTGHVPGATAAGFLQNGGIIYTCSGDGRTRLWNADTGDELCTMIAFADGGWAVVDPQGRFDAANGGDVEGLHWVVGGEPIELVQLKERYYEPGLLAKKLGVSKEPLRDVESFNSPKLYPDVAIAAPKSGETKFDIHLTNRGGGIGPVVVLINGKKFDLPGGRGAPPNPNAATFTVPIDLTNDPRLKPGETNKIEVQAFNADGYLRSRGIEVSIDDPREKIVANPDMWAVIVGITHYQGGQIDLAYPAKDASDFAASLQIAAARLFGPDHVHISLLTSPKPADASQLDSAKSESPQSDAAHRPTRDNLMHALEALGDEKHVKPSDILIIYLAGHGVARGGSDDSFYYLTCDAQNASLDDPELRRQWAVSDRELTDLLKRSPAEKQVMILDTCHSGKVVDDFTKPREVSSSQQRALERVKDSTGFHILAGCAADKASYEASRYGQGVLTYALLFGMRGAALKEDQFVDVGSLFEFAKREVPQLAGDIGGVQQPQIASPKGSTFEIGQVTKDDQSKIPLQPVRPLVLRTSFHDAKEDDPLALSEQTDDLLRDVASAARGQQAPLAFADARRMAGAYRLAGRYEVTGERVNVSVFLTSPDGKSTPFSVEGSASKVPELAAKICDEVQKRLAVDKTTP